MSEFKDLLEIGESIAKGEDRYTEEDYVRKLTEEFSDLPNLQVHCGTIVGSIDENGEVILEDSSVQELDEIQ